MSKDLSVAATNVTTICFVFLNLIQKIKQKILMIIKFIFDDRIKKDRERKNRLCPFPIGREHILFNLENCPLEYVPFCVAFFFLT